MEAWVLNICPLVFPDFNHNEVNKLCPSSFLRDSHKKLIALSNTILSYHTCFNLTGLGLFMLVSYYIQCVCQNS